MENGEKQETELEALARLVKDRFERMGERFEKIDEKFAGVAMQFTDVNRRIDALSYKVHQPDHKLDGHRQETKDGFTAMRAVMGGMAHTP